MTDKDPQVVEADEDHPLVIRDQAEAYALAAYLVATDIDKPEPSDVMRLMVRSFHQGMKAAQTAPEAAAVLVRLMESEIDDDQRSRIDAWLELLIATLQVTQFEEVTYGE